MKSPAKKSAGSSKSSVKTSSAKTPKAPGRKSSPAKKTSGAISLEAMASAPSEGKKVSKKAAKKPAFTASKAASAKPPEATLAGAKPEVKAAKPVLALEVEKTEAPVAKTAERPKLEDSKKESVNQVQPARGKPVSKEEPVRQGRPVSVAAKAKVKPPEKPLSIPPILLEGDLPPTPKAAGPGARYALAVQPMAAPKSAPTAEQRTELPEGYGTRRLFLTARDPRWLYASWDLMPEQQREFNRQSRDGHLVLRVYAEAEAKPVVPDVHVNPESRNFFVNVPRPETRYWAELGFYSRAGAWEQITKSQSTFTPPDAPSPEPAAVEFATIPVQVTFDQVVKTVQEFVTGHQPLLEAVIAAQEVQKKEEGSGASIEAPSNRQNSGVSQAARSESASYHASAEVSGVPIAVPAAEPVQFPLREASKPPRKNKVEIPIRVERAQPWTAERKEALRRLISIDGYRRVWMGSIEITELVRRQLEEEVASIAAAELTRQTVEAAGPGGGMINISSPVGGEMPERDRKFWFKVNAELIIYGATEPDAKVTVAERPVKLRPDGTFSFRFALPDGRYGLPAVAASADGVEARAAILEFSRTTDYHGHVEAHPQDSALRSPRAENL